MVAVTNPLWLVKTRLQLQGRSALRYAGLGDAVRTVLREEGVLGFYKGVVPALLLTSHGAVQVFFSSSSLPTVWLTDGVCSSQCTSSSRCIAKRCSARRRGRRYSTRTSLQMSLLLP